MITTEEEVRQVRAEERMTFTEEEVRHMLTRPTHLLDPEVRQILLQRSSQPQQPKVWPKPPPPKAVPAPSQRLRLHPWGTTQRCPDLTVWGVEDGRKEWQCPRSSFTVHHRGRDTVGVCTLCLLRLQVEHWQVPEPVFAEA